MGGKEEEGRGTGRSDRRKVEMRERGGGRGGAKIKIGVGGGIQQARLRQCDMAHAINSGSAERPCLAICSGSGAFEGVGVTPPPTLTPLPQPPSYTHTHRHNPSLLSVLAWQTPGQARVHFHKTIASQPAPVSGGRG